VFFTPLRSLFVVASLKRFSHHEGHEEHEGSAEPALCADLGAKPHIAPYSRLTLKQAVSCSS